MDAVYILGFWGNLKDKMIHSKRFLFLSGISLLCTITSDEEEAGGNALDLLIKIQKHKY